LDVDDVVSLLQRTLQPRDLNTHSIDLPLLIGLIGAASTGLLGGCCHVLPPSADVGVIQPFPPQQRTSLTVLRATVVLIEDPELVALGECPAALARLHFDLGGLVFHLMVLRPLLIFGEGSVSHIIGTGGTGFFRHTPPAETTPFPSSHGSLEFPVSMMVSVPATSL
jgi:hypothetical protein